MAPMPLPANRFLNLRTKFVLFFSLILILACSTLSWYFIENRREAMADNLQQLGTILLTSVVNNEHFQYAGLVAEDRATLQQFSEGLMAVQDVVYVVITGSDGSVLARQTKGARQSAASLVRSVDRPLYPDNTDCESALAIDEYDSSDDSYLPLQQNGKPICVGGSRVRLCHAGAANGKRRRPRCLPSLFSWMKEASPHPRNGPHSCLVSSK